MRRGVHSKVACGICPWNVEPFPFFLLLSVISSREGLSLSLLLTEKNETETLMVDWFGNFQPGLLYETSFKMSFFRLLFLPLNLLLPPICSLLARFSRMPCPPTNPPSLAELPPSKQIIGCGEKRSIEGCVSRPTIILTAAFCVKPYIWDLFRIIDCIIVN